jgi:hypothetical protein
MKTTKISCTRNGHISPRNKLFKFWCKKLKLLRYPAEWHIKIPQKLVQKATEKIMSLSFLLKKIIWKINVNKDEKLYNKLLFLIFSFKILKGTI